MEDVIECEITAVRKALAVLLKLGRTNGVLLEADGEIFTLVGSDGRTTLRVVVAPTSIVALRIVDYVWLSQALQEITTDRVVISGLRESPVQLEASGTRIDVRERRDRPVGAMCNVVVLDGERFAQAITTPSSSLRHLALNIRATEVVVAASDGTAVTATRIPTPRAAAGTRDVYLSLPASEIAHVVRSVPDQPVQIRWAVRQAGDYSISVRCGGCVIETSSFRGARAMWKDLTAGRELVAVGSDDTEG